MVHHSASGVSILFCLLQPTNLLFDHIQESLWTFSAACQFQPLHPSPSVFTIPPSLNHFQQTKDPKDHQEWWKGCIWLPSLWTWKSPLVCPAALIQTCESYHDQRIPPRYVSRPPQSSLSVLTDNSRQLHTSPAVIPQDITLVWEN